MSEHLQIANLTFEVRRSSRRRTLGLTVDRYGELLVHAPDNAPTDELQKWTQKKLTWVYRKLVVKESYPARIKPPAFVTGERFNYLGRSYPLRLVTQLSQPLSFDGSKFCLRREARPQATRYFKHGTVRPAEDGWPIVSSASHEGPPLALLPSTSAT
jgi:predicted metal-dependent hydrolase